jgi:hypothetical protein
MKSLMGRGKGFFRTLSFLFMSLESLSSSNALGGFNNLQDIRDLADFAYATLRRLSI